MHLNLTEAGKRLGRSRTWVKKRVDSGDIAALADPDTGYPVITEEEIRRYERSFLPYVPPQQTQLSQPSHADAD
jgi:hypothetical protein